MKFIKSIIVIFFVLIYSLLVNCNENNTDGHDDPCFKFKHTTEFPLRIFDNFIRATSQEKENITLVTQMSFDRTYMIEKIVTHWNGPISMAIYLSDTDVELLNAKLKEIEEFNNRNNIAIHLVYHNETILYPINRLRNIALRYATTDYVYNLDADFVPVENAYSTLEELFSIKKYNMTKKALVIAAFGEVKNLKQTYSFPRNKNELLELWDRKILETAFYSLNKHGHNATNYGKWRNASEIYKIEWEKRFEPYFVTKRESLPLFDERFNGYGSNKNVFCEKLNHLKYEFVVHSNLFVVHMSHPYSKENKNFSSDKNYKRCTELMYADFLKEIGE